MIQKEITKFTKKAIDDLKSKNYIRELDFGYETKFSLTDYGKS